MLDEKKSFGNADFVFEEFFVEVFVSEKEIRIDRMIYALE